MAGSAAAMALSQNRRASDGHFALAGEALRDGILYHNLGTRHLHWRQKFSIGKLRQSFRLPGDSDEILHVVVPRRNVLITNRPVNGDPFALVRLEIQIAPAIRLPAPHD